MADFGGIFDDLRPVGDDISSFFNSTLGQAIARGGKTLLGADKKDEAKANRSLLEEGFNTTKAQFRPTDNIGHESSNDFSNTEIAWIKRLQHFSDIVNQTEVKK